MKLTTFIDWFALALGVALAWTLVWGLPVVAQSTVLPGIGAEPPAQSMPRHDPNDKRHWYDTDCCNLRDCAPVAEGVVVRSSEGFHIVMKPGDHPSVDKLPFARSLEFGSPKLRMSRDENYHVCISPYSKTFYCLYVPTEI